MPRILGETFKATFLTWAHLNSLPRVVGKPEDIKNFF